MPEVKVVKSAFKEKLWSVSAYVKPGLILYALIIANICVGIMFVLPRTTVTYKEDWEEFLIISYYVIIPVITLVVASEVVTRLVMIVRSKKLYNRGRAFLTTIGVDQDSESKEIKEVKDEKTKKVLIPKSILTNAEGLSPWKIRGNKFTIFPEGTMVIDGIIEELEGGDYSWYKAWQLPHPALTEHLFRTEWEGNEDGTVTKKIIPIMPNFSYRDSEILWSPTGWNGEKQEIIGAECPANLLQWQNDRITTLEDEVRYWRSVKEKTVVVTKERPTDEGLVS